MCWRCKTWITRRAGSVIGELGSLQECGLLR
jgi:hypothetical protein